MEDREKIVIRVVGMAIILLSVAFPIIFIIRLQFSFNTGIIEVATPYIGSLFGPDAFVQSLVIFGYMAMQPDNLATVLIVLGGTIFIMIYFLLGLRVYFGYKHFKRYRPLATDIARTISKGSGYIKTKLECLFCGSEIPENAEYCPHCGETRARCSVCNKDIVLGDLHVKCPYCGALSHRNHLPKGKKEKKYCPNCKQILKEKDIA
ncbi:MAG: zinc ribbon domain-containing protein [Candidatus Freyarchaeum deiterrae]